MTEEKYPYYPGHAAGSETSEVAAEIVAEGAASLRAKAYVFIKSRGDHGATADEVAEHLLGKHEAQSRHLNTIRARVSELKNQGAIVDSGNTRMNALANQCSVWVVPPENDH